MQQGKISEQVSQRYAEALKGLALTQPGLLEQLGGETAGILEALKANPDLSRFLASPLIPTGDKKKLLVGVFGGKVHAYLLSFLQLLVDRRRIAYLGKICEKYQDLLRGIQKTTLVEVISAVPITDDQKNALIQRVLQRTGAKQIEMRTSTDPTLLGGMILKIGDEVIDASLRGQLRKLTLQLTTS
jgi:F-type H+-transporting ATPase subunit delta